MCFSWWSSETIACDYIVCFAVKSEDFPNKLPYISLVGGNPCAGWDYKKKLHLYFTSLYQLYMLVTFLY